MDKRDDKSNEDRKYKGVIMREHFPQWVSPCTSIDEVYTVQYTARMAECKQYYSNANCWYCRLAARL